MIHEVIHIKSINTGDKTLESAYFRDESTTRCAYDLRKYTIYKIEVLKQKNIRSALISQKLPFE